ncbi:hypothetical protein L484_009367 [Morus notabilis]|uniref:Expansin-like EG45 domain-containing protein n=1 Tax=Morus notabilis TaxID=981085 RepID=W9RE36_9ROSA|nr:hypothetical protein L484_009367 [Morus notabilis]
MAACGRSYVVTCIGPTNQEPKPCMEGEVVVKIVDLCRECPATLNLSQEFWQNCQFACWQGSNQI